jgi:hypothetical protein
MPEGRYYVRVRGKVLGPFAMPQLRALRDRGQFRAFHEVSEDRQNWTSAAGIGELFPSGNTGRDVSRDLPEVLPTDRGAPNPAASEGWRYVGVDGQEKGPVTRAGLLALRQDGTVDDGTLVWREGMSNWQPLASVGILSPAVPTAGQNNRGGRLFSILDALPLFLADPVGNLPKICTGLSAGAAFGMGVSFYVLTVLSAFVGIVLAIELEGVPIQKELIRQSAHRSEVILKLIALVTMPLLSLSGSIALVRLATRSRGNLGTDILIAGATWLPLGFSLPVLALLGRNFELVGFLMLVLSVLPILLLNSAFTRAMGLSDRGSIFAIPVTFVLSLWLFKVIFVALFGHLGDVSPVGAFPNLNGF